MKALIITLTILCFSTSVHSQTETYAVNSNVLNMRSGPGTNYEVLRQLSKDDLVEVLEKNESGWWKIQHLDITGYVFSSLLKRSEYADWEKKNYSSGSTPDCENITPEYDNELENYLQIQVGSNTDVVVKMMRTSTYGDRCIRVVYVNAGETYRLKNVPEGIYYLKIAYGKDYRQSIVDGKCYIKFIKSALYEKGSETMDFNVVKTSQGISVPYFKLFLDVVTTTDAHKFKTGNISEAEFNN